MTMSQIHPPISSSSTFASTCTSPIPQPSTTLQSSTPNTEEISTIFVVGFPDDITEREFQNMFIFCQGFEAATLKFPFGSDDDGAALPGSSTSSTASMTTGYQPQQQNQIQRRQIIGFAKFKSRQDAIEARDVLCLRHIDPLRPHCVIKAEMAKKNLHVKHRQIFDNASAFYSSAIFPSSQTQLQLSFQSTLSSPSNGATSNAYLPPLHPSSSSSLSSYPQISNLATTSQSINITPSNINSNNNISSRSSSIYFDRPSTLSASNSQTFHPQQREEDDDLGLFYSYSPFPIYPQYLQKIRSDFHHHHHQPTDEPIFKALTKLREEDEENVKTSESLNDVYNEGVGDSYFGEYLAQSCINDVLDESMANRMSIPSASITMTQHLLGTSLTSDGYTKVVQFEKSHSSPSILLSSTNVGFESALYQNLQHFSSMQMSHQTQQNAGHQGTLEMGAAGSNNSFLKKSVKPVLSDQNNPPCNTLYVGNLPLNASEDELKDIFNQCPGYKRMCFRVKPNNGPMCFVEFESVKYATMAMNNLYGSMLSNSTKGGIRLSFSKNPLGVRSTQCGGVSQGNLQDPQPQATF